MEKNNQNNQEYFNLIKGRGLIFVLFRAEWCDACRLQSKMLYELSNEIKKKIKIVKIDVDEQPHFAQQNDIKVIPTIIAYKNGQPCFKSTGLTSKGQIAEFIINLL